MADLRDKCEKLIQIWNEVFPQYPLTVAALKKPHSLIDAFLLIFNKLGIDVNNVLTLPPEEEWDSHTAYYCDLLPAINVTRVVNHLLSKLTVHEIPCNTFTLMDILQPNNRTSYNTLLMLINMSAFHESRLNDIAPYEKEIFAKRDQVKTLEEKKNNLLKMLNKQAEEKGKRAERLAKLDEETKQLEEELKREKESHAKDKEELKAVLEKDRQAKILLEQKKNHLGSLLAEVAKKKALRVYDADDIRAQAEKTSRDLHEAEEKLNSLKAILMEKENSVKNLQKIKPELDSANNLLYDVLKLSEKLKQETTEDKDIKSEEDELAVAHMDLVELQGQLAELQAERQEFDQKQTENESKRQLARKQLLNETRDAEESCKKSQEYQRARAIVDEIKLRTLEYAAEKKTLAEKVKQIEIDFKTKLQCYEEALLKKVIEAEEKIKKTLQDKHLL